MSAQAEGAVAQAFGLLGAMRPGTRSAACANIEARCGALHWIDHLVRDGQLPPQLAATVVQRYVLINWSYLDRITPTRAADDVPADLGIAMSMLTSEPLAGSIDLTLDRVDLRGALLWGARLDGARLGRCRLAMADLGQASVTGASFVGSNLDHAILFKVNGRGASFFGSVMVGAVLKGAYLPGAVFDRAILRSAVLVGANLCGAHLSDADLSGANLSGCDLREADLSGTTIEGAQLAGANLDQARLDAGVAVQSASVI
jgi:uncharacterized protein YjbI with pentapeptide repeats